MEKKRKLDKRFSQDIIEKYLSGKSTLELGTEYGVNPGSIHYLLKKKEIKTRDHSQANRTYDVYEDFFDTINTSEKAYFLGILYADGCNSTEMTCVRLILSEQDSSIHMDRKYDKFNEICSLIESKNTY
jgi:hypothetical protein